jgi:MFS family permease
MGVNIVGGVRKVETRRIRTQIPARLDRLPWSRWHWIIVIGLGTVWILDGLEVTVIGGIASRLSEAGSGLHITAGQVAGGAAAAYIGGACLGALLFGYLTDRFGRKKLFMITLAVYLTGAALTALSFSVWWFFMCRFITGAGIGGEYSAINSAIDELMPARLRGRIALCINGSYWVGAIVGALLGIFVLNTSYFPKDLGWRLAFAFGVVLGLGILIVRRLVPESPRWLIIHGRADEAEAVVADIERQVRTSTGAKLEQPDGAMTIRQRRTIGFVTIARTLAKLYRQRMALGFALFVGQAFLYNAILFSYGDFLSTFFHIKSGDVPYYLIPFAAGNFLGAVLLSRLFDTIGRKPMITGTYVISGALLLATAYMFDHGQLTATSLVICWCVVFFFASAGASAAYLTVGEVFPMETRALAIAFFYAIGTAAGGIAGPLLFAGLIDSKKVGQAALALTIGAALMIAGGVAELLFGVRAERRGLEEIAKPLTVEDGEESDRRPASPPPRPAVA